jgi:predicted ATPase/class 3 adenylate cyclase
VSDVAAGDLPTGTVTFLFTDIEGSTNLARSLRARWPDVLEEHHSILRRAIRGHRGVDLRTEGDAFFAVFPSAVDAIAASAEAQRELARHDWPADGAIRVRMGMHTGEGRRAGHDYVGLDVHRAARIGAAATGGQVLVSDATRALVAEALPEGVSLRDLGEHRLKDFDHPQRIFQLVIDGLASDFSAIRTLERPTNLPAELTSFVGRAREIEEVRRLLETTRLVTLTGPGGSGKTRLSLRVATSVADRFPDGVHFVELASITDATIVPSVIASSLGIREEGPRPILETLRAELRERTALLVLDNFEQVIEAAPLISSLLAAAPRLRILVTSRGALRLQGEQEFPVPPLELPDPARLPSPEELSDYEAIALFVNRARAVDPGFTVTQDNARAVAEICARLDGLPLAIELAASRLRLMSAQAMLQRLERTLPLLAGGSRDLPARQRTLRAAITWSYDLLSKDVAALFRRLSVFAGGFSLDAAETICDPEGDLELDALEGLEALLDNAMVRRRTAMPDEARFDMLQTIREFGLERLQEDEEAPAIARRHAAYFLTLAERAEPQLRAPDSERYLDGLELEHDNLRTALTWAITQDEGEVALRFVAALWRFWHLRGHLTAGRRWADDALALPSASLRTADRARALWAAGGLAYWQTDPPTVRATTEEALAIARELADREIIAEATYHAAFWHPFERDFGATAEILGEALAMFEKGRNRRGVADSLFALSVMDRLAGGITSARTKAEEALRIHRELGDMFGITGSLFALGRVAAETGDLDTARSLFLESMDLSERMGDRTSIAIALDNLADQENKRGHYLKAIRVAGASAALKDAVGGEAPPAMLHLPDPREAASQHLTEHEIQEAWEEGRGMTLGQALAYARKMS